MPYPIKDDYYDRLLLELAEKVPEFVSVFDIEDGPYSILGEFGRYLRDKIEGGLRVDKEFEFLNYSLDVGKHKTEEVVVQQVFQELYPSNLARNKSMNLLKNKHGELFAKFLAEFRRDNRIEE